MRWSKFQVGNYSQSELNAFRALANTGIIRADNFLYSFNQNSCDRLKELKMIETRSFVVNGVEVCVIRLTGTGKKFVKSALVDKLYKYNMRQLSHDLCLSEKYMNLSQKERNTWIHEGKMEEQYERMGIPKEKIISGEIQTIDGCYTNFSGETVGVEVFTSNYSQDAIHGKMSALKLFSGGAIIDKVK